jgi:menaquinol-cytochrome c reductase iron-sulfur subunit
MSNSDQPPAAPEAAPRFPMDLTRQYPSRRRFISQAGLAALGLTLTIPAAMSFRSVIPNMLYEPPKRVKVGPLENFAEGGVFIPEQRVFVFREGATYYCINAICSHLGCTVQLAKMPDADGGFEFHCPCHGSMFRADGTNFAGPAPRPLDYFTLELSPDDGQLIVDKSKPADKAWRFTVRG